MSRRNVAREWDAAVRDSGLPRISLHGARHTFVTTALANRVAQSHGQAVAAVMGTVYGGAE